MSTHYVQYHKHEPGNEIKSRPGAFEVWTKARPQPKKGDIIWLLSGRSKASKSHGYLLEHYFKAQDSAQQEGERWVILGNEGKILGSNVGNALWFKDFFTAIGRGSFGLQKINVEYLKHFLPFMSEAPEEHLLDDAIEEAEKAEHNDDVTILKAIKTRRGQGVFRKILLDAYESRCCFTDCRVVDILEAAHISSHSEEVNYQISNGLLLRADIHTLFDLHLIAVDKWYKIHVSKRIKDSEYHALEGKVICLPKKMADHPNQYNLDRRLKKLDLPEISNT